MAEPDPKGFGNPSGLGLVKVARREGGNFDIRYMRPMRLKQPSASAKPAQYSFTVQTRRSGRGERVIRGVLPMAEVVNQPVALGIVVDVGDQTAKMLVGRDFDSFKRMLKQTAGTAVGFVDRLGIGVEQI